MTWLVGVGVVVAISVFALLALRRGKAAAVPFPHVTHPLQARFAFCLFVGLFVVLRSDAPF